MMVLSVLAMKNSMVVPPVMKRTISMRAIMGGSPPRVSTR